jgi:hypothetical protein
MNLSMRNSIGGVSGMGWPSQRASKRALACLAVFGIGGMAGLLAGFSADPVQTSELSPAQTSELSPAQIVALRFPGESSRIAANPSARSPALAGIDPSPAPSGYVLASAAEEDVSSLMFNPFPTYSSAPEASLADSSLATSSASNPSASNSSFAAASLPRQSPSRPALPPQLVTAGVELPAEALAYADEPATRPESPYPAKRTVQAPHPASMGPASPSNAMLNSAQIASIRDRLRLTSYQSQLWPPVESALRDISWRGRPDAGRKTASNATSNGHGTTIDPNSPPVQRLKSAAVPLIMSLSDDQKEEVRTMVRLMGLENLASQF